MSRAPQASQLRSAHRLLEFSVGRSALAGTPDGVLQRHLIRPENAQLRCDAVELRLLVSHPGHLLKMLDVDPDGDHALPGRAR